MWIDFKGERLFRVPGNHTCKCHRIKNQEYRCFLREGDRPAHLPGTTRIDRPEKSRAVPQQPLPRNDPLR